MLLQGDDKPNCWKGVTFSFCVYFHELRSINANAFRLLSTRKSMLIICIRESRNDFVLFFHAVTHSGTCEDICFYFAVSDAPKELVITEMK